MLVVESVLEEKDINSPNNILNVNADVLIPQKPKQILCPVKAMLINFLREEGKTKTK